MEMIEALRTRRSTKSFSDKPVPKEKLLELIDAARYSPSGSNKNPWRFVIVTERKTLERLSEAHPHCRWLVSAQAGIAVLVDLASTRYWLEDCCLAAYSIWLAGTARGLGVAWGAMYQSDNSAESERRQRFVRQLLSIPDGFCVPMVLAVGYPNASPPEKRRPEVEDIVYWERYASGSD